MRREARLAFSALFVAALVAGYFLYRQLRPTASRLARLHEYWDDPAAHADWSIRAGERCGQAPFLMPTDGYIGFFWGDSFRPGHHHQGVDIFGPSGPDGLGQTPVVAAYDGYVTRLPDWRASLIERVPRDPLDPGRQIWIYYTHMADPEGNAYIQPRFPAGTSESFVRAGTLLGYQGNYSADPDNPTGLHLHFSIIRDDGRGDFTNELDIANTLDPSPYLGIEVNASRVGEAPAVCLDDPISLAPPNSRSHLLDHPTSQAPSAHGPPPTAARTPCMNVAHAVRGLGVLPARSAGMSLTSCRNVAHAVRGLGVLPREVRACRSLPTGMWPTPSAAWAYSPREVRACRGHGPPRTAARTKHMSAALCRWGRRDIPAPQEAR